MLALLNLLPLPPLDGSGAVTLLMNEDTAARFRRFVRNPAFTWIGLLIAWKLFGPIDGRLAMRGMRHTLPAFAHNSSFPL